jgi:D-glycero-D-manno-heptose 1,7-bisphosphate phosphatase
MLLQASEIYGIDFGKSFMIGDRWRDVNVGYTASCKTIFIDYQYDKPLHSQPDYITISIKDAAEWVLQNQQYIV